MTTDTAAPTVIGSKGGDEPGNATPKSIIQEFELEFAEHVNSTSLGKQGFYATVGAGAATLITSIVALPLLPLAFIGGVQHGIEWARQKNKEDLGYGHDSTIQRPTSRRLRHFVVWAEEKLSEAEANSTVEIRSRIINEIFRLFSPWLQHYYLLRSQGQHGEDCGEAWQTLLHLMPFYYLLQARVGADAFCQEAQMLEQALDAEVPATADASQQSMVNFAGVLDVIAAIDCLRPAAEEKLLRELCGNPGAQITSVAKPLVLEPRGERRQRFQTLSAAMAAVVNRQSPCQDQQAKADKPEQSEAVPPTPVQAAVVDTVTSETGRSASPMESA